MDLAFSRGLETADTAQPPHRELPLEDRLIDNFSQPLAPSRAALRAACRQLETANGELQRANDPVSRLASLVAHCDEIERAVDGLRQQHLARLGRWLGDGGQPECRPVEPRELLEAEQRLVGGQADAAAARQALPEHHSRAAHAAERVRQCMAARDAALRLALIDMARDFLPSLAEAYSATQQAEAVIADVEAHLLEADDRATASQLRELVGKARAAIAARLPEVDAARGRNLVGRLLEDPEGASLR